MTNAEFDRLVSVENLVLAWRRVTTGRNFAYKRYYRGIMHVYESASGATIKDLSTRLRGIFRPAPIARVFQPKPSGLHRSISLLGLEDQIVYQGLANMIAVRTAARRSRLWG